MFSSPGMGCTLRHVRVRKDKGILSRPPHLLLVPNLLHLPVHTIHTALGSYSVSAAGVPTVAEVSRVKDWVRPKNRKEVLQFLGFAGYYKRYMSGYSSRAGPVYHLTTGEPKKKRREERAGAHHTLFID